MARLWYVRCRTTPPLKINDKPVQITSFRTPMFECELNMFAHPKKDTHTNSHTETQPPLRLSAPVAASKGHLL